MTGGVGMRAFFWLVLCCTAITSALAVTPAAFASDSSATEAQADVANSASTLDEADASSSEAEEDLDDEELADAQAAQQAAEEALELGRRLGGNRGILPSGVDPATATYVSIARLARADVDLDNTVVSFRGEVVGEPLNSSIAGRRWVTMQTNVDGTSSIGVLMDEEQIGLVEHWGAYGVKGTTLLVTGIYRVADTNQSGTIDVVAYDVRVLEPGESLPEHVSPKKIWLGAALTLTGAALLGINVYLRRRVRS